MASCGSLSLRLRLSDGMKVIGTSRYDMCSLLLPAEPRNKNQESIYIFPSRPVQWSAVYIWGRYRALLALAACLGIFVQGTGGGGNSTATHGGNTHMMCRNEAKARRENGTRYLVLLYDVIKTSFRSIHKKAQVRSGRPFWRIDFPS